jgi:hypothetical protein
LRKASNTAALDVDRNYADGDLSDDLQDTWKWLPDPPSSGEKRV